MQRWNFLPSSGFDLVADLIEGEDKLGVLYDCAYHASNNDFMSKTQDDKYKFPCVYSINKSGPTFRYSNTNTRGHFGTKKVIFSNGAGGFIVDEHGTYGLTQFGTAIVEDDRISLEEIVKIIEHPKFEEVRRAVQVVKTLYNSFVLRQFSISKLKRHFLE